MLVGKAASDLKQLVRVYANVKRLAQASVDARVIDSTDKFEGFIRGFNCEELLFDFVDVGSTGDRADGKVEGMVFREINLMVTDDE